MSASTCMFDNMVKSQQSRLFHFVLRQVFDPCDADDLTQQTFVEAWRCYSSYRGDATLHTWLFGIARNLVRNHQRRLPSRRYEFVSEDHLEFRACDDLSPAEVVEQRTRVRKLNMALRSLDPEMREALLLVTVDGMSYREAARMLGIPVGTVRSRISRGRAQLRANLFGDADTMDLSEI